ncbi:Uncharacterised protein [Mycobacteroides abscessus subsp. abscessus]|nr:Uncharacterised protein [Mycobacteroides abscessus subsp. abscessus]
MKTIELWPRPVLGPSKKNRLGMPAMVMPRCAVTPWLDQRSPRSSPPCPLRSRYLYESVTWKPVPKMMASTLRSIPSPVTTPSVVTRVMASVTNSVFRFSMAL